MSRPMDFRATTDHPVDAVYAAMSDRAILADRLERMGGPGAGILEYASDEQGCRYRIRHGIDEKDLPGVVKTFVGGGGITVERDETWRKAGDGYDGTVRVALPGMPAGADGTMRLEPAGAGTSFHVHCDITVRVPLIGGKIEETVAEQIKRLLAMETDYTLTRL
ncbi:DUF2505 domain-containing protein [Pseudonocardia ailaonensis]|uniref:DUF2505 domain-containing protein n=1 Tax=Pseudonocardia ailaonensis TaxID=367279 RepID=A0ABN2NKN8_9PSEU